MWCVSGCVLREFVRVDKPRKIAIDGSCGEKNIGIVRDMLESILGL